MAVNIHYITDPVVLQVIDSILALTGPNFTPPYDSATQPVNGSQLNAETLLQMDLPGGSNMQGMANSANTQSIAASINTVMAALAPFLSAYAMLLPIFGIIKAIIEVLCALLNPWAVAKALIKLFIKYIPPLIALWPPLAGIVFILNLIKIILSIVFYILSVVVPTIQLIIANVKKIIEAIEQAQLGNYNEQSVKAAKAKIEAIIKQLIAQLGIMGVVSPILDFIMIILSLTLGLPCKKKKKADDDGECCEDDVCPPELLNPPSGSCSLSAGMFGALRPSFVSELVTGNQGVSALIKYYQNFKDQISAQTDEEIDEAKPAGSSGDQPLFFVKISNRRGNEVTVPVIKFKPNNNIIISTIFPLTSYMGQVSWEIIPNYEMLVAHNIIGIGCHPDVAEARDFIDARYPDLDTSIVARFPPLVSFSDDYNDISKNLKDEAGKLSKAANDLNVDDLNRIQDKMLSILYDYKDKLLKQFNDILAVASDRVNSTFEVEPNVVKADGITQAFVIVTPKHATGVNLASNLPQGATLSVSVVSDFGNVGAQTLSSSTGTIIVPVTSIKAGTATVSVKINGEFISDIVGTNFITRTRKINFISEAILPTRRLITTPQPGETVKSGSTASRETRGK